MTENQKLKLQIIKTFANIEKPETITFCKEAYKFIMEDEAQAAPTTNVASLKDGIYYLATSGNVYPYESAVPTDIKGVLIVQGSKRLVVSLHDANNGEDCALTTSTDPGKDSWNYAKNYDDAVADWNGIENTEHLKRQGLNPGIALEDGQYIPSMGEMLFVFCHRKAVNEALAKAGAAIIDDCVYWTSTECSATSSWFLYINGSGMFSTTKAVLTYRVHTYRVRPVSAFLG